MSLSPGLRLGRYEIRSQLGAGGMAEVYLAEDTELGRHVALKLLPPDTTTDEHARKRLIREARAAATLDHPHICAVYDIGEAEGRRFIAMQYLEGEPLDARLKRHRLELGEVLAVACDIADALTAAHAHGIVHRDVKPSNVMITPHGGAVMLDFGLAKLLQDDASSSEMLTESLLSAPGAVIGTVPYMSPEQVRGETLDGRTDVFSFGVLLYEMLSGQRPFVEPSPAATASAILTREPAPLARFSAGLPAELERIVTKALRKNPDERYQSTSDLSIDLRALRDDHEFRRRLERSGLPTADETDAVTEVTSDVTGLAAGRETPPTSGTRGGRLMPLVVGVAVVAVLGGGWWAWGQAQVGRALQVLPQVEALAAVHNYVDAYALAADIESSLVGNPTLARLMSTVGMTISATSEPSGARVYLMRFDSDDPEAPSDRRLVGTTPIVDLRIARGEYIMAIEKDGFATVERTVSGAFIRAGNLAIPPRPAVVSQTLFRSAVMPAGMVFVPGGDYRLVGWSRPTDTRVRLDDYFIDKYEVTNREYKEFIDAGGYLKREYWNHPFVLEGRRLSWEEAVSRLKDRTGLAGPRGWSEQKVPDGRADHPVTDITWHEAAAYAAFRGRSLPTVFQWEKAARDGAAGGAATYMPWGAFHPGDTLVKRANFENDGTVPVASNAFGMSPFGAYNMAGNVAEWTANDTSEGRVAAGGAWGDPTYVFAQYPLLPGFYSSNKLGFRCVQNAPNTAGDQGAARIEISQEIPSYTASSAAAFAGWQEPYRYDRTPLDARVEEIVETSEWRREKISFNGAAGQRPVAYLYFPIHFPRPLQVVHLVPAGDVATGLRSLPASMEDRLEPFIKSGRAAFGVVLKGYIGRLDALAGTDPDPTTIEYLERIANHVTDLRRGLDYLGTRDDIDMTRVAFFGPSAGARLGLIHAAVESRYRAVVLQGAGLPKDLERTVAAANPINFAPHIRGPKLMIQGLYDEDTPLRTEAEPLYALLREPKKLVTYEGGHVPSVELLFTTISGWLDEVMGPVRR